LLIRFLSLLITSHYFFELLITCYSLFITYALLITVIIDQVLDEMRAGGLRADTVTFSACITACEKAHRLAPAMALFREMEECGLRPNVVTYSALISACAKVYSHPLTSYWLHVKDILFHEIEECGLRTNVVTYSALISACAKVFSHCLTSYWLHVKHILFREMEECGLRPNVVTYSACAKMGAWQNPKCVGRSPALMIERRKP
jgi:pentatricopeptide repeat domain-containing protein 1